MIEGVITMNVPNALQLTCDECQEVTMHEVLRGRIGKDQDVIEATVKCLECGKVYTTVVREAKSMKVPIIVSEMGRSQRLELELGEEEILAVDDELVAGDMPVIVSAIEVGERRVRRAMVKDISTIWAKRFDKVRIRVAINKVHKTISVDLEASPDEEFFVDDLLSIGREEVVIHYIKTKDGMVRRGSVPAREIVRIYAKAARRTYS
jgi:uncharacterized Zn finger protein